MEDTVVIGFAGIMITVVAFGFYTLMSYAVCCFADADVSADTDADLIARVSLHTD